MFFAEKGWDQAVRHGMTLRKAVLLPGPAAASTSGPNGMYPTLRCSFV